MVYLRWGWASIYIGYPNRIRSYKEASFKSYFLQSATKTHGRELQLYGVEAQNYMGVGERYQISRSRVLNIARARYPSIYPEIIIQYTVKSFNGTMGPERLVP